MNQELLQELRLIQNSALLNKIVINKIIINNKIVNSLFGILNYLEYRKKILKMEKQFLIIMKVKTQIQLRHAYLLQILKY